MNTAVEISKIVNELNFHAPLLREIQSESEHDQALELMEALLEDYDSNQIAIDALTNSISRYESQCVEFVEFNKHIEDIDPAVATLKVLMSQHNLNTSDFEHEIGKKSMVSQVLNGKKKIGRTHIERLAKRFDISPSLFFY